MSGFVRLKREWTQAPPVGTPIDRTNKIGKYVRWCLVAGEGAAFEAVTQTPVEYTTPTAATYRKDHPGRVGENAANNTDGWSVPPSVEGPYGADERFFIANLNLFENDGGVDDKTIISYGTNSVSQRWTFKLATALGGLRIEIQGTGFSSALNVPTDEWVTVGCRFKGTQFQHHQLYLNDSTTTVGADTTAVNTSNSGGHGQRIFGDPTALAGLGIRGQFSIAVMFDKGEEFIYEEFRRNPWQIFEPRRLPLARLKPPATQIITSPYIERPWTKQPPPGTPFNWSHPAMKHAIFIRDGHSKQERLTGQYSTNSTQTGNSASDPGRIKGRVKGIDYTGVLADVDVYPGNSVVTDKFEGLSQLSIMAVVNADTLTTGTNEQRWFMMQGSTGAHNVSNFYLDTKELAAAQRACAGFINQDPAVTGAFISNVVFQTNKTYSIGGRYSSGTPQWCHLWAPDIGHHNATSSASPTGTIELNRPISIGGRIDDASLDKSDAVISFVAAFDTFLPQEMFESLLENPWQLFEPRRILIPRRTSTVPVVQTFTPTIKRRWTRQPPPGVGVDWSNPITKGLHYVLAPGNHQDLARNLPLTLRNGADVQVRSKYRAFIGDDVDNVVDTGDTTPILQSVNDPYTFLFFGLTTSLDGSLLAQRDGTIGNVQFHLRNPGVARELAVQVGATINTVIADDIVNNGSPIMLGCTSQDGSAFIQGFVNGKPFGSGVTATGTPDISSLPPTLLMGRWNVFPTTFGNPWGGDVYLTALWKRGLTDEEMLSLWQNPWQIFQPRRLQLGRAGPAPPTPTDKGRATFRRPWKTMPPPGKWEIDWDNPFTKDLMFACAPNLTGDKQIDLVTGYQGTIVETVPASVNITPNRPKYQFNVPHCVGDAAQLLADCSIDFGVHSEWNSPAQENSMVCFFYPETPINDQRGSYPFTKATTVPGANEFATYVADITLGTGVIERVRYRINGVGDLNFDRAGGSPDWANQWIYLAGSCDASSMDAWLWSEDGAVLSATGTGGNVVAQTSKLGLYGRPDEDRVMPGYVFLALAWNRSKSAEFHRELFKNPWQIFKPRQLPVVPVQAATLVSGAINSAASVLITPTALLTALGELNLTGALSFASVANLLGRGELDINGALAFAVIGNAAAKGLLTSTPALTLTPTANIVATGELDINSALAFTPTANLLATGELDIAAALTLTPTADLAALGQLDAAATIIFSVNAQLGSEKINANPQIVITPTALLTSTNEIQSAASLVVTPTGTLLGQGELNSAATMQVTVNAVWRSDNEINASAQMTFTPSALLISQRIFAQAAMTLTPTADVDAFGFMQGAPQVTLSMTGTVDALGRLDIDEALTFTAVPNLTSLNLIDNQPTFISITPNPRIRNANTSNAEIFLTITPTADGDARGALSGNPLLLLDANANAEALEQINAAAELLLAVNANMQALSALDANMVMALIASGDIEALGDLQSAALLNVSPLADLSGFGRLSAKPNMHITENALIEALGAATAQGSLIFDVTAVGKELLKELAQANPQMFISANGLLTPDVPSMDANAALTFSPSADVDGKGHISGDTTIAITPTADISLIFDGSLDAQASLVVGGRAKLLAVGALDALSQLLVTVGADIDGEGALGANPQVQLTVNALQTSLNEIRANPALILDMNVAPTLQTSAFAQISFSLNALAELILGVADVEHIGYITRLVEDIGYITRLLEAGGYITRSVDAEGLITRILEKDLHV